MSWKEIIKKCLNVASAPIRRNANFFVFMYLLSMVSSLTHLPKGTLYENLFLELFVDLYVVCAIVAIFPKKVRRGLRAVLYIILYSTAAADTYCFVNFGSTLNPSMLMLVGETNSSEASSFLSALISVEVLFSSVGWILLLALLQILIVIFRKRLIKIYVFLVTVLELASLKKRLMAIPRMTAAMPATFGILCLAILITSICTSWHNKVAYHKLMTGRTIGEVEHTLTEKDHAVLYLPIYRLQFSIYANQLAAHQITQLIHAAHEVKVDQLQLPLAKHRADHRRKLRPPSFTAVWLLHEYHPKPIGAGEIQETHQVYRCRNLLEPHQLRIQAHALYLCGRRQGRMVRLSALPGGFPQGRIQRNLHHQRIPASG